MYLSLVLSFSTILSSIVPSLDASMCKYPYVVRIENIQKIEEEHILKGFITGSMVTPAWTLTCAHCISNYQVKDVRIRYGDMSEPWQNTTFFRNAIKFVIYPSYRRIGEAHENDIGLIRVDNTPLKAFARLSGIEYTTLIGASVEYVGYCLKKQKVNIDITKPLQIGKGGVIPCEEDLFRFKPSLCVGPKCNKQVKVYGDSGGPLFFRGQVVGVSAGGTFHKTEARVLMMEFTPIAPYLDWIINVIS